MGKSRAEHLAWAKERAVEIAQTGDLVGALSSISSDITKHPETNIAQMRSLMQFAWELRIAGQLGTPAAVIKWIEDII